MRAELSTVERDDHLARRKELWEARSKVGHPEVNVYPLPADAVSPGDPREAVWQCS